MIQLYNELRHYGISGMRWGTRRSSYSNNSPGYKTSRRSGMDKVEARRKAETDSIVSTRMKVNAASGAVKEAREINNSIGKIRSKKVDLSNMTDQQLKEKVARMNMENQYHNLSSGGVSKGQAYVSKTLDVAGTVLAIGSSALGIALAVQQLKTKAG